MCALPLAPGLVYTEGAPHVYVSRTARVPGDETKGRRVELRLAVKVGSSLEAEGERGFAHYCEHLAFQSTTSYGAGEIVDWLRTLGSAYGPDLRGA